MSDPMYVIAESTYLGGLESEVNMLIGSGYEPIGGASVLRESYEEKGCTYFRNLFFQAMVRKQEPPK